MNEWERSGQYKRKGKGKRKWEDKKGGKGKRKRRGKEKERGKFKRKQGGDDEKEKDKPAIQKRIQILYSWSSFCTKKQEIKQGEVINLQEFSCQIDLIKLKQLSYFIIYIINFTKREAVQYYI